HNIVAIFIAASVFLSSCQKDNQREINNSAKGTVSLKIDGASFGETTSDKPLQASTSKRGSIESLTVQQQEVPLNREYNVKATLTPTNISSQSVLKASNRTSSATNRHITEPLDKGTEYTVYVYEKANPNREIVSKTFKHGVDDSNIQFELDPGEYTFVSFAKKEYTRRIYNPNTTFYYTVTDYGALHWKKDVTITAG